MSATELIKEIQTLPEAERERIFEFVLHSKKSNPHSSDKASRKSRLNWSDDFAKVKKEIGDENPDDAWLNTANEWEKDWQW